MLKIDKLNIITVKGRDLVKDLSFVLNDGDKVGVIGEEGNGKSTILKIIAGIDVSSYATYSGSIYCDGIIGYLSQNINEEYLDYSVMDYIVSQDVDYTKFYDIVSLLSLDDSLFNDRVIRTLSGGEKVKVNIARVLYRQPDVLLLDEPTNDLDLKTLIWLEEFIKNSKLPIMFVSHDETLLENCSNAILHIEQLKRKSENKITYSGLNYKDYIETRNYNINRINSLARKEKQELNKQLEKYRKVYAQVDHAQKTISRQDPHGAANLKDKMHSIKAQEKNIDRKMQNMTQKFEPEEAINIFFEDISLNPNKVIVEYELDELKVENKILSKDIYLKVLGKDKICIIGENGAGKSTLIKKIYETIKNRDDIKVGYISQNYYEVMDYSLNPVDYLMLNHEYKDKAKITTYLGSLKFTSEEMSHNISELSEGQKCKILFVKMIIDKYDVLILDEPTRNLSPLSNPKIREIINDYGGSIISISHDRKFINECIDTVYELNKDGLRKID